MEFKLMAYTCSIKELRLRRNCYKLLLRRYSSVEVMKVLNVAEKNDAAKNIAGYLSRGTSRRREGLSPYNKIYEFSTYLWNRDQEMIMTSVSGHLLNYEFVGAYRKWNGCHPLSLFDAPVMKGCMDEFHVKIKKTLEREIQKCAALIIWTDCDREGENIGFEIIEVCRAVKPSIKVYRAKFSEITQISVNRALQNLGEPDKAVSDAVDVRSELDLRIGAAFTRFQTMRLKQVFPTILTDMMISYGSCQFPTLGFVVERFLAIERFKPEPYWKIKVMDVHDDISVEFRWSRGRLFEKLPCEVLYDVCIEQPDATVLKVSSKPKSKWRPLPLDTVELEKQGSRKLHLSAKETMKIAEKLYTQGFISYPRTETNIFPKELNLTPLVNQQVNNPSWGNFAQQLLQKGLTPRQGKKSDQAHPPIHPTKYTDTLQGNEAKVYEFVVRHFLACLSSNAVGQETTVEIVIAGENFVANGLQIIERNYLTIYIYERWSDKEIHTYREGQVFRPTSLDIVQEETTPPQLLTEADLIGLMDKYGIGTDATHAEHIDTIKNRQYVGLVNSKHLVPGKLGIGLVKGYDDMGFEMSKPHLRADLEKDLKLVCERQKNPKEALERQIKKYRELFKLAMERANLIDNALANYLEERPVELQSTPFSNPAEEIAVLKCPNCGSNMTLKTRKQGSGKYIGCMGYPACRNAIWFPQNVENVEVMDEVCSVCSGNIRKLRFILPGNAFPLYGNVYETCIGGCDQPFNELMNIKDKSVRIQSQANDSGYRSTSLATGSFPVPNEPRSRSNSVQSSTNNASVGLVQRQRNNPSNNANNKRSNANNRIRTETTTLNSSRSLTESNQSNTLGSIDNESVIMCNCNETAIQLTVRKEGPNQGRLFYKCAKPRDTGCDFFLWAPDENNQIGNQTANRNNISHNSTNFVGNNDSRGSSNNEVLCNCNEPAVRRTVQKEGVNKGRLFYCCHKGIVNSCKFFQWADESMDNASVSTNNRRSPNAGHRKRTTSQRKPRAGTSKRKCGICGQEGHTRKTCPENALD